MPAYGQIVRTLLLGSLLSTCTLWAPAGAEAAGWPACLRGCFRKPSDCFIRAGHPQAICCCAKPSDTPAYGGYYVGGGAACHGGPRAACEGTWGWDYFGRCFPRRVALGWFHGRKCQGGQGAYKTDGPKIFH